MQALRLAIKRIPRTPSRAYSTQAKNAARLYSPIVGEEKIREINDAIVRVDHAGEYGAQRIYDGQIAVLGNASCGNLLKEMRRQERDHYRTMRKLVRERRVRPSLLHPFWHVTGYAIGYGSALAGQEGAMACTVGVERVIASHYNDQLRELVQHTPQDTELRGIIKQFRDEEMDHHDWGADAGGKGTTLVDTFTQLVDWGTKLAVAVAKRI